MDVEDNADALRLRDALQLVRGRLTSVLDAFADRIEAEADTLAMAYTHLQPAEPTTVGYRLSQYAQDFILDLDAVDAAVAGVRGKGLKGAVGTMASYEDLLEGTGVTPEDLEARVMRALGLRAFPVSTQTYPRKMDYTVLSALAGVAQSAYKFALDVRLLQSPLYGEMAEPFGRQQVGSSAMPFKRNPVSSESVCSLARYVAVLPRVAWDNAAHSALERTLDDSANRREALPEAFLAVDEILVRVRHIVSGLRVGREAIARNLQVYGPFAATEPLLMALVRAGASRQEMHERIRDRSMQAWAAVQRGEPNPLVDLLAGDPAVVAVLPAQTVRDLFTRGAHAGTAPARSRAMAIAIRNRLAVRSGAAYGE